jgi:hypothetical protein
MLLSSSFFIYLSGNVIDLDLIIETIYLLASESHGDINSHHKIPLHK